MRSAAGPARLDWRRCPTKVVAGRGLRRLDPDDLVEAAEADVERRVGNQLDDLGLREVPAHLRPERVVDLPVIDRELLGEPDRGALARAQEVRRLVVDR